VLFDVGFAPEPPPTIDKQHSKNAVTHIAINKRRQAVLTPRFGAKK
jgi:hypothetical protein